MLNTSSQDTIIDCLTVYQGLYILAKQDLLRTQAFNTANHTVQTSELLHRNQRIIPHQRRHLIRDIKLQPPTRLLERRCRPSAKDLNWLINSPHPPILLLIQIIWGNGPPRIRRPHRRQVPTITRPESIDFEPNMQSKTLRQRLVGVLRVESEAVLRRVRPSAAILRLGPFFEELFGAEAAEARVVMQEVVVGIINVGGDVDRPKKFVAAEAAGAGGYRGDVFARV